jgi:peroxiredoxin
MNRSLATRIGLAMALILSLALATTAAAGGKASDFTLKDIDGRNVSLSDYEGKVVIISFWATWCTPCKAEMPELHKLYKALKDQGLVVLSISTDEARNEPQVKGTARAGGYTFPVLLDPERSVFGQFSANPNLPVTVIIDQKGQIQDTHAGYEPGDEVKLKAQVEALLGIGDAPDTASGE